MMHTTFAVALLAASAAASPQGRGETISFPSRITVEASGIHNVHLTYNRPLHGSLSIHYGNCDAVSAESCHHKLGATYVGDHPLAKRHEDHPFQRPSTVVWLPPDDITTAGCLHAFSDGSLVGRSEPVTVGHRPARRSIDFADIVDSEGPWFDGVQHIKDKEPDSVFVASSKTKHIGIIGGGMSGLMTAHLLDSVGIHNWTILEASERIGGRVKTVYLNGTKPDEYQYQEMGAMRFPVSIQYPGASKHLPIKDHQMVFQLADVLNQQNGNGSSYHVNFIPWTQDEPNDPADTSARTSNGTVPGAGQVAAPAYAAEDAASPVNVNQTESLSAMAKTAQSAYMNWTGITQPDTFKLFVSNIFEAHKKAVDAGYFDWSESQYIWHVLNKSANTSDTIDSIADTRPAWMYEDVYYAATKWLTIDQGVSRLPQAFEPQVLSRTRFNTSVHGISWKDNVVEVKHRTTNSPHTDSSTMNVSHAIVTVPFSLVRLWDLPPYSSLLQRAITNLQYAASCKVAMRYKTRFWEHLPQPITGGCGAVNITGIGNVCYPSYKVNSSGPGVMIGSYIQDALAESVAALSETEHITMVQESMEQIHGLIAKEQWTGEYVRECWNNDQFSAGAWANPAAGQQPLYLPAYFQTEFNTIFVGEHTSYTHAWIWSALESSVRGTTQLLLDMGLVDEAKEITQKWMARWIRM